MSKTVDKTKQTVTDTVKTTARIVKNIELFVQAVALLVVSIFAVYASKQLDLPTWGYYGVLASAAVIGLRGGYEFIRFLNKESK